jgi:hypothetical protein
MSIFLARNSQKYKDHVLATMRAHEFLLATLSQFLLPNFAENLDTCVRRALFVHDLAKLDHFFQVTLFDNTTKAPNHVDAGVALCQRYGLREEAILVCAHHVGLRNSGTESLVDQSPLRHRSVYGTAGKTHREHALDHLDEWFARHLELLKPFNPFLDTKRRKIKNAMLLRFMAGWLIWCDWKGCNNTNEFTFEPLSDMEISWPRLAVYCACTEPKDLVRMLTFCGSYISFSGDVTDIPLTIRPWLQAQLLVLKRDIGVTCDDLDPCPVTMAAKQLIAQDEALLYTQVRKVVHGYLPDYL